QQQRRAASRLEVPNGSIREIRDLRLHTCDCSARAPRPRPCDTIDDMNRWTALLLLTMVAGACALKNDAGSDAAIPAPPDVAAPPADALKTASGLASKMLRVGLGRD